MCIAIRVYGRSNDAHSERLNNGACFELKYVYNEHLLKPRKITIQKYIHSIVMKLQCIIYNLFVRRLSALYVDRRLLKYSISFLFIDGTNLEIA